METVLEILKQVKPSVDFTKESNLIEDGILESLEILMIIAQLKDEFAIDISPSQIVPENFSSAETIWKMVETLMDE